MEFPTSSSLTVTDTNSNLLNQPTHSFDFQLQQNADDLLTTTTTPVTATFSARISSPVLTPPTPISPREPQSPDGHTSVSSTGSSDTISDSSTQGGFSDPGSVESESLESPTPPAAAVDIGDCNTFFSNVPSGDVVLPLSTKIGVGSSHKLLHTNCVTSSTLKESSSTTSSLLSDVSAGIGDLSAICVVSANTRSVGVAGGNSALASSSSSSSAIGHSNGGSALYAHSSSNQYNQSHSSSSSSGCSSTSSTASGGCNNNSSNSGSGGLGGSTTGAALGVEHFIGSNNHTASNVTSTTAAATSLAHVKLQQDQQQSQQQFAIADSNTNNVAKSFVPCKVCGDKASGYHYGVTSCEGCKGFFRRSIQKQIEYRCLRDGKCLVIRLNRNRCQYCRFKKCLSAGMSRDSVRYGRVPKRSRELNGTPSSTDDPNIRVSTPGTPNTPQTPQMCSVASPSELGCTAAQLSADAEVPGTGAELTVYDVIVCVSQAHRMHCTYTEEQTRELMRRPISVPQNGITTSIAETMEFQKIWLWQQYAARITPGVQRIVEFAKRVPGFCDFTQDDQLILIKLGFFEVWLSHVARMINDSTLTFDDGAYLTRQQLEILYDSDFVISLINYANTINAYGLSDTEIGLFSAMVLLVSDRSGISEHKAISRARERIAEALRVQIVRSRPGTTQSLQLMPALEAKIPELRSLGAKHFSHLDWLRMNWTKLRLPPLFAEIFDIPKTEDDL